MEEKGERVRMYVLNAGPSIWSAFHVIGSVFDRTGVALRLVRFATAIDAMLITKAPRIASE